MSDVPTEEQEMRALAQWLDWHGILWAHPPQESPRHIAYARRLKAMGMRAGLPDVLVFDIPPAARQYSGVAIELKRRVGGRVSKTQETWLRQLDERGWYTRVCQGADEAIEVLERLGYGRRGAEFKDIISDLEREG